MIRLRKTKSKLVSFFGGLFACVSLLLGARLIAPTVEANASSNFISDIEFSLNKVDIGDSVASLFDFEDEANKMLTVPANSKYSVSLEIIWRKGQGYMLWSSTGDGSWTAIENEIVDENESFVIRFKILPQSGYELSTDLSYLTDHTKITGLNLGKGKDIELWDVAGYNKISKYILLDFILIRGMDYIGGGTSITPRIGEAVSGRIGGSVHTGFWIVGAATPYTYEAINAPIGLEIESSNVFSESNCYYKLTAKNSMNSGTAYVIATAANGKTCKIPLNINGVSGGHEHTYGDIECIDGTYHGRTTCSDPSCPGVSPYFDVNSDIGEHDYYGNCTVSCKTCGEVINASGVHDYKCVKDPTDSSKHIYKCECGALKYDSNGNLVKEEHRGGNPTCTEQGICIDCNEAYLPAIGHKYEFKVLTFVGGGGEQHILRCATCNIEDTSYRHAPTGGVATCAQRAICSYSKDGHTCNHEYGEFIDHNFENGICKDCHVEEVVRSFELEIPKYRRGMSFEPFFYPTVTKGNVINRGDIYSIGSKTKDADFVCNINNAYQIKIDSNSLMIYQIKPQANHKFPSEGIDAIEINIKNGILLHKELDESTQVIKIHVMMPLEDVVQKVDVEFGKTIIGNKIEEISIKENNGLDFEVVNFDNVVGDGTFLGHIHVYVTLKLIAPDGMMFANSRINDPNRWLCDFNITRGTALEMTSSADNKEVTIKFKLPLATDCTHDNVTLKEAGFEETCTSDGRHDKYLCLDCEKEFVGRECEIVWNEKDAVIKASHKVKHVEANEVIKADENGKNGKDGNIAYYECKRSECGKLFLDEACKNEITLEETIIHDYKSTHSADDSSHYYECHNCNHKKDIESHSFGSWINEIAPTTEEFGVKGHQDCSICKHHFDENGKLIDDLRIAKIGTHKITITGGNASSDGEDGFYKEGDKVTIVAEPPKEGKRFAGWVDADGNIVSTDPEYTFTVTKEMVLIAKYEDIPLNPNSGLSGGAIAGIVIGSSVAASLAGFSLFWFVIKKKSFNDLILVTKGIFKKK